MGKGLRKTTELYREGHQDGFLAGQEAERKRIINILNTFRWKLHDGIKEDLKPAFSALFMKMIEKIEAKEKSNSPCGTRTPQAPDQAYYQGVEVGRSEQKKIDAELVRDNKTERVTALSSTLELIAQKIEAEDKIVPVLITPIVKRRKKMTRELTDFKNKSLRLRKLWIDDDKQFLRDSIVLMSAELGKIYHDEAISYLIDLVKKRSKT